MNPNIVLDFVEWAWTLASLCAVGLSLWALPRAYKVLRDMQRDLSSVENQDIENGRLDFANQQLREGKKLLRAHGKALAHQLLFLSVGLWALYQPNNPIPVGAPLMEIVGAPVMLLVGQYIILWLQLDLVGVTSEQKRWREETLDGGGRDE